MNIESLAPFIFFHREVKVRCEYSAKEDKWLAHFNLPKRELAFQRQVHPGLFAVGPDHNAIKGESDAALRALACRLIDEYLEHY